MRPLKLYVAASDWPHPESVPVVEMVRTLFSMVPWPLAQVRVMAWQPLGLADATSGQTWLVMVK